MMGTIVSLKAKKTAVVDVASLVFNRRYLKNQRKSKKYHCHYEPERIKLSLGQRVTIAVTAPRAALKRWRVVQVYG